MRELSTVDSLSAWMLSYLRLYRPMVFESRVKGSRVKLEEEDTVAMRKSGINNAVVFSKDPIQK